MLHILAHHGRYVHRHEDLIAIAGECGGQILALFEYWTACREAEIQRIKTLNSQIKGNARRYPMPDKWLRETLEDVRIGLLNGWGVTSIKKTIKELVDKDYLVQSKHRNPWLRTKCYQLNIPVVQKALDEWKNQQQGLSVDLGVQSENPCTSDESLLPHRVDENNLIDKSKTAFDYILNNPNEHSLTTSPGSEILEMQNKKELSSNLPAFLPDPEEKNVSGGAGLPYSNITEWLDAVLAGEDEYIHPAMKSFKKSTGWKYPWRTSQRDEAFGTCDSKLVEFIAKKWQSENKRSEHWRTRIPDVIKHINDNEQTKSGLEKILGYWKLASKSQKSTEVQEKPKRQRSPYEPPPGVKVPHRPQFTTEEERLKAKAKEPVVNLETLQDNEWVDEATGRRMKVEGELIYEKIFQNWVCVNPPPAKKTEKSIQFDPKFFPPGSSPFKTKFIKARAQLASELGCTPTRDQEILLYESIKRSEQSEAN